MAKRTAAGWGEKRAAPSRTRTSVGARFLGVGLLAAAGAGWLARLGLRSSGPTPAPVAAASPAWADEPQADWCAPGFEPIDGGACFAQSPAPAPRRPLVLYLHGRYAADASADEVDRQRRLAVRATRLGFSVLALRGRLATCTAPELGGWYCWPSNERNADLAEGFVTTWARALSTARDRAGARSTVLLGFSNGGYFAGLIASRALVDTQAVVVAHGGPVEPVRARGAAPPLLLLSADDDVAQDEMIRFDEELAREGWPHDSYARFGGHSLTDEDIDAALGFFQRIGEPLPLSPPLPLHRPVRHDRDASADRGESQVEAATDEDNRGPDALWAASPLPTEPVSEAPSPAESSSTAPSPGALPAAPPMPSPSPTGAPSELPSTNPYGTQEGVQGGVVQ